MTTSQRLGTIDWIGVALWVFRAVIIILVIVGTVRKLFFGAGTQYTASDWIDFVDLRPFARRPLCPDCPRLHHGLWRPVADQLRPRRVLHVRAMTSTVLVAIALEPVGLHG